MAIWTRRTHSMACALMMESSNANTMFDSLVPRVSNVVALDFEVAKQLGDGAGRGTWTASGR